MQVDEHLFVKVSPYKFSEIGQTKTQVLEIGSANLSSPLCDEQAVTQVWVT